MLARSSCSVRTNFTQPRISNLKPSASTLSHTARLSLNPSNQRQQTQSFFRTFTTKKETSIKSIPVPVAGVIKKWHKTTGDYVHENEPVVTIQKKDHQNFIFNSPEAGVITDVFGEVNSKVTASADLYSVDVCGYISKAGEVSQRTESSSVGPSS